MAQTVTTTSEQNTVVPGTAGAGGNPGTPGEKGARNQAVLNAAFPGSPIYAKSSLEVGTGASAQTFDYSTPDALKTSFINNVTKGSISDAQFGLSDYDLDFQNGAPNLATEAMSLPDNEPKPANGFVPNINSPGEGSLEAKDKPAVEADDAQDARNKALVEKKGNQGFVGDDIVTRANLATQGQNVADRLTVPAAG